MKTFHTAAVLLTALVWGCGGSFAAGAAKPGPDDDRAERSFEFFYSADVTGIPPGAQDVQIWFPIPQSDKNQEISNVEINTSESYTVNTEPVYGNKICYIHVKGVPPPSVPLSLHFRVTRYEDRGGDLPVRSGEKVRRFLRPSHRGAIIPEVKETASRIAQHRHDTHDIMREVYRYVIDHMEYRKEGAGWGNGDTSWACSAGYGNCTDYHALFIALSQALGVPAHFDMGFPLPSDRSEGTIEGYHCWAHFYLPDRGWVPVDVSEADKHPQFKDYFYGAHDPNRVKFTTGRDIMLEPRQNGGPLNYFIYPYVEVDGVPHTEMTLHFRFRDL